MDGRIKGRERIINSSDREAIEGMRGAIEQIGEANDLRIYTVDSSF
jgi:hypothetical protein